MKRIKKILISILLLSIGETLFSQQYKAFNINGNTIYKWCNWETTSYKYEDLKTTEKCVDDSGNFIYSKTSTYYPGNILKSETLVNYSSSSIKHTEKTEFSENGNLQRKTIIDTKTDKNKDFVKEETTQKDYYEDGYIKSSIFTTKTPSSTSKSISTYNKKHFLTKKIEESHYSDNDSYITTKEYKWSFNEAGNPARLKVTETNNNDEPKTLLEYKWKYTDSGLIKYFEYSSRTQTDIREFFYDSNDLLIESHYNTQYADENWTNHPSGKKYTYIEDDKGHLIQFEQQAIICINNKWIPDDNYKTYKCFFTYDSNDRLIQVSSNNDSTITIDTNIFPVYPFSGYHYSDASESGDNRKLPKCNTLIAQYKFEKYFPFRVSSNAFNYAYRLPSLGYYEYDKNGNPTVIASIYFISYDSTGNPYKITENEYTTSDKKSSTYEIYYLINNNYYHVYHYYDPFYQKNIVLDKNESLTTNDNGKFYVCKKDDIGRIISKNEIMTPQTRTKEDVEYSYNSAGNLFKEVSSIYTEDSTLRKDKLISTRKTIYNNNGLISKILDEHDHILEMYVYKYNEDGSMKNQIHYNFTLPTDFTTY